MALPKNYIFILNNANEYVVKMNKVCGGELYYTHKDDPNKKFAGVSLKGASIRDAFRDGVEFALNNLDKFE